MRKVGYSLVAAVPLGLFGWMALRAPDVPMAANVVEGPPLPAPAASAREASDDGHDDDRSYVFRIPSGDPTALSCEEARTIVEQVRSGLAYAPEPFAGPAFATSAADWLDPHGLLSLAKDAPTTRALARAAPDLIADIEGKRQRGCASASAPAGVLESWVAELREAFDRGRTSFGGVDAEAAALDPIPPTGIARETAEELGRRAGAFESAYGPAGSAFADEARKRFFPSLDRAGWSKVVLASAVRAYVPLVDPHGEWAPFDEESRIYEVDLASRPPSRLWGHAVPTAIGVRLTEAAAAPLAIDDVVLSVAHVATAGLPLEQIDQLGFASTDARTPLEAIVLRRGKIVTISLTKSEEPATAAASATQDVPVERIPFGEGDVLLVTIKDVRDDLGDELAQLVADHREGGVAAPVGVRASARPRSAKVALRSTSTTMHTPACFG